MIKIGVHGVWTMLNPTVKRAKPKTFSKCVKIEDAFTVARHIRTVPFFFISGDRNIRYGFGGGNFRFCKMWGGDSKCLTPHPDFFSQHISKY